MLGDYRGPGYHVWQKTVLPSSQAFGHLCSRARASSGDAASSSAHVQTDQRVEKIQEDLCPSSSEPWAMVCMVPTQFLLSPFFEENQL